ncbi:MAG: GNAT family N-acetyltransferase [Rikenellaceae bacterium]
MGIELASREDLNIIMDIYAGAVELMNSRGNASQWVNGYPDIGTIEKDIELGRLYVLKDEGGRILCQFCFYVGEEPSYNQIDGHWTNDASYGVVHRLASSGLVSGVGKTCLEWCYAQHANLRIDTHEDNRNMQELLRALGYHECGTIRVYNGTERVAFQKCNI